jgi:hypothetical protein
MKTITMQEMAEAAVGGAKFTIKKVGGKEGGKFLAKQGFKVAGKTLAKTASSPWLIAADAAEIGVEKLADEMGFEKDTAKYAGKTTGALTSVGIGAAVAGPVGALAGLGLWVAGEALGSLFG